MLLWMQMAKWLEQRSCSRKNVVSNLRPGCVYVYEWKTTQAPCGSGRRNCRILLNPSAQLSFTLSGSLAPDWCPVRVRNIRADETEEAAL